MTFYETYFLIPLTIAYSAVVVELIPNGLQEVGIHFYKASVVQLLTLKALVLTQRDMLVSPVNQ